MKLLVFTVNDELFGLDSMQVFSIKDDLPITKQPSNSKSDIVDGMVTFLDEIIIQIDLSKYLYNKSINSKLSLIVAYKSMKMSLKVQDVKGIMEIEKENIMPVDNMLANNLYMIDGFLKDKDTNKIIQILRLDNLVKDISLKEEVITCKNY